jgi:hypothetical protein
VALVDTSRLEALVGKVTLKSIGDEALSDESFSKKVTVIKC